MSSVRLASFLILSLLRNSAADHHEDECVSADPCDDTDGCHQGCPWWITRSGCEILASEAWEHRCGVSNPLFSNKMTMAYYCPAQCPDHDNEAMLKRYKGKQGCKVWCKGLLKKNSNGICMKQPASCGACDECQGVKPHTYCNTWCHKYKSGCWKMKGCEGCINCIDPKVGKHVKKVMNNLDQTLEYLDSYDCPSWCTQGDTRYNEMPGQPTINCDFKACQGCLACRGRAEPLQEVIYKGEKYLGYKHSEKMPRRLENSTVIETPYVSV